MRNLLRAGSILFLLYPPAMLASAPAATTLELSVIGAASRPADAMAARLTAAATAPAAAAAQSRLNMMVASALHDARAVKGVTVTTSGYDVSPVYPKRDTWEARQSLNLTMDAAPESTAAKPMLALIGHMQTSGLMLESLSGTLTPAAKQQAEQAAIQDAVKRLKEQVDIVATALGDQPGNITGLHLNVSRPALPIFRPMALAATTPSISAAPVAEHVTLSGTVSLTPRNP